MPPDYGQEATQMFSQRNNPYCDLLSMYYERIFSYISPQKNRAVKNKSYFYNCYGKEEEFHIKNQG
jgi:hypothetical protein